MGTAARRAFPRRTRPAWLAAACALAVAVAASGCGPSAPGKPSLARIEARLRAEPRMGGLNAAQVACVARVALRYGDAGSLERYATGRITAARLTGRDPAAAAAAARRCAG